MSSAAVAVAIDAPPRPVCVEAACTRTAVRRGLCSPCYRLARHGLGGVKLPERRRVSRPEPLVEPSVLQWRDESGPTRALRTALLHASDRLLNVLEEENLVDGRAPAPPEALHRYWALGGTPCWPRSRLPTGAELHAALLDLQEAWLLRPALVPLSRAEAAAAW